MKLLDIMPLLAVLVGTFLLVFILFRRSGLGKNRKVRYSLASLVFIYTFIAFDYHITISAHGNTSYFGISYLVIHLIGFLFYYFIILFTKTPFKVKKWLFVVLGYTLLRWAFLYPLFKYESFQDFLTFTQNTNYNDWLELEYLVMSLINILLIFLAFFRLRNAPMVLQLDDRQALSFKWAKLILTAFIVLQMGVLVKDLITNFTIDNYEAYMKFETLMITIFFFIFSYSIMHFPVFAFTGDFEDLPQVVKKKYAKSSLVDSSILFEQIKEVVEDEQLYLDFDIKLNSISERLDKSVHHVSQAINENTGNSFPDFINSFRIAEAKKKLLEPKPDTIFAISLDVGFNSKAAFYTAFKKATSQTPSEFKKSNGS